MLKEVPDMKDLINSEMDNMKVEFAKELESPEILKLITEDSEFAMNADSIIRELTAQAMAEAKKII